MWNTLRGYVLDLVEGFEDVALDYSGQRTNGDVRLPPFCDEKLGGCTQPQAREFVGSLSVRYLNTLIKVRDVKAIRKLVDDSAMHPSRLSMDENAAVLYTSFLSNGVTEERALELTGQTLLFLTGAEHSLR